MTFSRHTRIATFVAACVAAGCANSASAGGQADAAGTAAPAAELRAAQGAGAADGSQGPEHGRGPRGGRGLGGGPQASGEPGFGGSRPGAPGLDGPIPHGMPHHGPGGPGLFRRLHHLDLSEAQQDKLFAITHAAAPQQRNAEKAERKALETLHTLGASAQFDAGRASAAARALGQAVADGALLQARLESQVLAVLTPEQREQLRQEHPPGPPPRPERP